LSGMASADAVVNALASVGWLLPGQLLPMGTQLPVDPLGAIGAIEIAACALVIERGVIPPTINYQTPDPECDLDYVPNTARQQPVDMLVSTASGFGGFQSALLLSKVKEKVHV